MPPCGNQQLEFGCTPAGWRSCRSWSRPDFPTTPGAYDTTYNGAADGFVARLSADGKALLYSTFLGGSRNEGPSSLAVDTTGRVTVAAATESSDFPTTPGGTTRPTTAAWRTRSW
jgi:hypothetical protein